MGKKFRQISGSRKTKRRVFTAEGEPGTPLRRLWGRSQLGHQRPREIPDLEMVGMREGRSDQGLKTGG